MILEVLTTAKEAHENIVAFDYAKGSHDFTIMKAMETGMPSRLTITEPVRR